MPDPKGRAYVGLLSIEKEYIYGRKNEKRRDFG